MSPKLPAPKKPVSNNMHSAAANIVNEDVGQIGGGVAARTAPDWQAATSQQAPVINKQQVSQVESLASGTLPVQAVSIHAKDEQQAARDRQVALVSQAARELRTAQRATPIVPYLQTLRPCRGARSRRR
jgi:hypothetical protein